jgi:glycosyltransferase involved in cell wall biosynthesis
MFAGPSAHEPGPGNVYLEAMACGRPVIAGNTAGTPEVVEHGRTGLLIQPGDLDDLEAAIVRLADQPAFADRLAQAGRQFVVEHMAVEKYLDKVERFYERLLRQPHRDPGDAPSIGARE